MLRGMHSAKRRHALLCAAILLAAMGTALCAMPRVAFADPATITVRATGRTEDGRQLTADEAGFILAASDSKIDFAADPTAATVTHTVSNEEAWVYGSADTRPMRIESIAFSDSKGATVATAADTDGDGELELSEIPSEITVDGTTIRRTDGNSLAGAAIELHFEEVTASFAVTYNFVFDPWQISFMSDGQEVARYERWAFEFSGAAPEAPAKPGYIFKGWFDGDGDPYDPNHWWQVADEDQVLHAVYEQAYGVFFDPAGGTLDGSTTVAGITLENPDDTIALPASVPVRSGWIFTGWYLGDTLVEDGMSYAQLAGGTGERSLTLTAHWQEDPTAQRPEETGDPSVDRGGQDNSDGANDLDEATEPDTKDGELPATDDSGSAVAITAFCAGALLVALGLRARQDRS